MIKNMKRTLAIAIPLLLVGLAGFALMHQGRGGEPDGLVFTNGRLESDRVAVSSKVPGRVLNMLKQEGDAVTAGELIARLDDSAIAPKVDEAQAAVRALEAQLAAKQAEVAVARKEAPLGVQASEAQRERAAAQAAQTERDAERLAALKQDGAVDAHHAEEAKLAAVAAATQLQQAERQLAVSRLAIDKVAANETGLQAVAAQLDAARAQLREAQTALDETRIKAPMAGVVAVRAREPGEVVGAGGTLFELYDPSRLYMRAYVPESDIGKLKLGLPARVWIDAWPGRAFDATLTTIANRAEFTPKEVQTHDERVKEVFGVKLHIQPQDNARLAPGLPADATIRYRNDVAWQAPK